jgi:hypothetical protein
VKTITGPRAGASLEALRRVLSDTFEACFRVIEEQPEYVKLEIVDLDTASLVFVMLDRGFTTLGLTVTEEL